MPLINLIQEQRQSVKATEAKIRILVFGVAGMGGLTVLATGWLLLQTGLLELRAASLEDRLKKVEPALQAIEANESEIGRLRPRLATLTKAQEGTGKWIDILDHLSRHTPEGVWLTDMRTSQSDPTRPVQVSIKGVGGSQDAIGAFLLRLQASERLERVALKFTQERVNALGEGIEFDVVTYVKGSALKEPEVEEGQTGQSGSQT
jgi:Tfp pilus assembly protein PilN